MTTVDPTDPGAAPRFLSVGDDAPQVRRRRFLATGPGAVLTAAIAGCTGSGGCSNPVTVRFEESSVEAHADHLLGEYEPEARELAVEVVERGSIRYGGYDVPAIETRRLGPFLEYGGSYYVIHATDESSTEVPGQKFRFDYADDGTTPGDARVVDYGDLPEVDREAVEYALTERFQGGSQGTGGTFYYPYPGDDRDASTLVEGVTWVRREGAYYRVEPLGRTDVARRSVTFEAEKVAASRSEWLDFVAEYRTRTLDLDSSEARDAAQEAIEGSYETCADSAREDPLLDALARPSVRDRPPRKFYFVRYEGTYYDVTVS